MMNDSIGLSACGCCAPVADVGATATSTRATGETGIPGQADAGNPGQPGIPVAPEKTPGGTNGAGLGTDTRLQLALNVPDLAEAVAFYSEVFAVEVHKERPGYANFEVAEPPLKLVLFEVPGAPSTVNHLGVEGFTDAFVSAARARLDRAGFESEDEHNEVCCHAEQNKVITYAPDRLMFEFYRITDDQPAYDDGRI